MTVSKETATQTHTASIGNMFQAVTKNTHHLAVLIIPPAVRYAERGLPEQTGQQSYKEDQGSSHLFNQGVTSVELPKSEPVCCEGLREAIEGIVGAIKPRDWTVPLDNNQFRVLYGVVTHKSTKGKSDNLPLFSRVSLMWTAKRLRMYGVDYQICFIEDQTESQSGIKKDRKRRASKATTVDG